MRSTSAATQAAATYVGRDGDQMKFCCLREVPAHERDPDCLLKVNGQHALERIRYSVVLIVVDRVWVAEPAGR